MAGELTRFTFKALQPLLTRPDVTASPSSPMEPETWLDVHVPERDVKPLVHHVLLDLMERLALPGVLLHLKSSRLLSVSPRYALGLFASYGVPDEIEAWLQQDLPSPEEALHLPLDAATRQFFAGRATHALVSAVTTGHDILGTLVVLLDPAVPDVGTVRTTVSLYGRILAHVFAGVQLARDLYTLLHVTQHLVEDLDLDTVLQRLLHHATRLTGTEAASILLYDARAGKLTFQAAVGPNPTSLAHIQVPLDSIAGKALRSGKPLVVQDVEDASDHFRQVDAVTGFKTRSLVAVPIVAHGQPVGVLEVLNKQDARFDEHDVALLQALASHAAVIIRQAQLAREREIALNELRVLDERKTQFIHLVSHELRTPLTIVRGYAEMLLEEIERSPSPDATTLELVAREILEGVRRLSAIVEEITRATMSAKVLDPSELTDVDLRAVVQFALDEMMPLSRTKGLHLEIDLPDAPLVVRGHEELLREAVVQVVNNAVKFTPEGGRVRVSLWEDDTHAMIRVEDTGPGIPPDEVDRIFQPFYQVEQPLTRQHPGLGLGLTIAKQAIERHGGEIWVDSTPGEGSVFTLLIPKA